MVGLFTDRVPLSAGAESGLPVQFAVVSGPANVENGFLRLTRRPERSPWPAEIRVVALQPGGGGWKATEPAYRTLRVEPPPRKPFVHPGLLDSRAELDDVRARIQRGEEPWASRWKALLASDELSPRHHPSPRAHVVRDLGGRWEGSFELGLDSRRAYSHALAWALGGDPEHARRAAEFLDAWSEKLLSLSGHDARLLAGITGHKFCNAAELLRHTGAAWPADRQTRFRDMMRRVYVPLCRDFYPEANGNWDASMILTLMSIGVHLDDHDLFRRAVEYALHGEGNGAIPRYINPAGVCQESARDQQHTQLGLGFLADACETAWTQGVDLYAAFDNRLATGFEFTAGYNLGAEAPDGVKVSPDGRGRFRPVYARVVSHYRGRLGIAMPKSVAAAARAPSDALQWDHLPWQALTEEKPAKR
ncbi:MAG: alginate lyase family protein [Kiritimatiellia bacterium]